MEKKMTCIVCPLGCSLTAKNIEGKILVVGNSCPRGEKYAKDELLCPKRTVTSTARCVNGAVVAVKTERPIDKDKIFECMKKINSVVCDLPISVGDVIIEDVCGSRVVATQNIIK